jgi:hypothetical protein
MALINEPYPGYFARPPYPTADFATVSQSEKPRSTVRILPPPPPPGSTEISHTSYGRVTVAHAVCQWADALYGTPDIGTIVNGKWIVVSRDAARTANSDTMVSYVHYLNREHPEYVPPVFPSVRTKRTSYELDPAFRPHVFLAWLLAFAYLVAWLILR